MQYCAKTFFRMIDKNRTRVSGMKNLNLFKNFNRDGSQIFFLHAYKDDMIRPNDKDNGGVSFYQNFLVK